MREILDYLSNEIETLKNGALFGNDHLDSLSGDNEYDASVLSPMSEQHFLLALAALGQAQHNMTLAAYLYSRGD